MSDSALRETMDRQMPPPANFTEAASVAALSVRKAFSALVAALPGHIYRPRDLELALGLDYKLCWRVINVVRSADGLAAANQVPKKLAIQRLLEAAARAGVSEEITRAIRAAHEQFEEAVRIHAGNRTVFEAMVSGAATNDDGNADLLERRTAFRANSHLWGLQLETFVTAIIFKKSQEGVGIDRCQIMSRMGFRRLRQESSKIVYRYYTVRSGEMRPEDIQQPIDVEANERYGAPLLPEFSTKPLPKFAEPTLEHGWVTHELASDAIGRQSEVDLTFATATRQSIADVVPSGEHTILSVVNYQVPARRAIQNLVVHRPSFGIMEPHVSVYGFVNGHDLGVIPKAAPRLPVRPDVIRVNGGIDGAQTPEVLRLGEMITYACNKLGWDPTEFDVYQMALEYPILHSVTRIQFYYRP